MQAVPRFGQTFMQSGKFAAICVGIGDGRREIKMDIYNFINSPSAGRRRDCRSLVPLEIAFSIWQSRKYNLSEKHISYLYLAENFGDCHFYLKPLGRLSLSDFLKEYIFIENKLRERSLQSENTVYTYFKRGIRPHAALYSSKRACLSAIGEFEQYSDRGKCRIVCRPVLSAADRRNAYISLQINNRLEDVFLSENGFLSAREKKIFCAFSRKKSNPNSDFER